MKSLIIATFLTMFTIIAFAYFSKDDQSAKILDSPASCNADPRIVKIKNNNGLLPVHSDELGIYQQLSYRMKNEAHVTLKFYDNGTLIVDGSLRRRSIKIIDKCSDMIIDNAHRGSIFGSGDNYSRSDPGESTLDYVKDWHKFYSDILDEAP